MSVVSEGRWHAANMCDRRSDGLQRSTADSSASDSWSGQTWRTYNIYALATPVAPEILLAVIKNIYNVYLCFTQSLSFSTWDWDLYLACFRSRWFYSLFLHRISFWTHAQTTHLHHNTHRNHWNYDTRITHYSVLPRKQPYTTLFHTVKTSWIHHTAMVFQWPQAERSFIAIHCYTSIHILLINPFSMMYTCYRKSLERRE